MAGDCGRTVCSRLINYERRCKSSAFLYYLPNSFIINMKNIIKGVKKLNIKKLSATNSSIVNITFSNQIEYKEYLNAIKKSSGMIAKAGNFSISADSLMAAYNMLKTMSTKNRTTGEITVKLSGSQITDILPLFFCMSLYMVEEHSQKVTKTIAQTQEVKGDMALLCGRG